MSGRTVSADLKDRNQIIWQVKKQQELRGSKNGVSRKRLERVFCYQGKMGFIS